MMVTHILNITFLPHIQREIISMTPCGESIHFLKVGLLIILTNEACVVDKLHQFVRTVSSHTVAGIQGVKQELRTQP